MTSDPIFLHDALENCTLFPHTNMHTSITCTSSFLSSLAITHHYYRTTPHTHHDYHATAHTHTRYMYVQPSECSVLTILFTLVLILYSHLTCGLTQEEKEEEVCPLCISMNYVHVYTQIQHIICSYNVIVVHTITTILITASLKQY